VTRKSVGTDPKILQIWCPAVAISEREPLHSFITSGVLRASPIVDDKSYMRVPLFDLDLRLVALSSFIVIIAMYIVLALVERMKSAQGVGRFAWLVGGASGMGIGIWSMHYLGLQALGLSVPMLGCSSVPYSILATIFASGATLLVVSGKSDSGRGTKEGSRCPIPHEIFARSKAI
jgi:Bacterial signalling protein N terminal repeat